MKYLLPMLALLLGGCQDKVLGLLDNTTPLVTLHVKVTGDLQALRPAETLTETPHLRVALVWGGVNVPDPFCAIYQTLPLDPSASALAHAGCRDVFGFAPSLVGESVPVAADGTADIPLINLPNAAVLIGEITSRVGYASILVFDDRNDNGTLELHRVTQVRAAGGPGGGPGTGPVGPPDAVTPVVKGDFVYGASFISMTQPDQRIAYMEGPFDANNTYYRQFYPRSGCADGPPGGFSVLSAGGFSALDGLKAIAGMGTAAEDPASCSVKPIETVVTIALQATETVRDVACAGAGTSGAIRYAAPDMTVPAGVTPPFLLNQTWACLPTTFSACMLGISIPGVDCSTFDPTLKPSLAVAAVAGDCKGTTHYILKGCAANASCDTPEWDFTTPAKLPAWWPCSVGAKP